MYETKYVENQKGKEGFKTSYSECPETHFVFGTFEIQ